MDEALAEEFKAESLAALAQVERHLLRLESSGGVDAETVDEIFRAVHSIKGGAGFLDLNDLVTLAHHAEALMDEVRKGNLSLTPAIADQMLAAVDGLGCLLEGEDADVADLCRRLNGQIPAAAAPQIDGIARPDVETAAVEVDASEASALDRVPASPSVSAVTRYCIEAPLAQLRGLPDCAQGIFEGFSKIGEVCSLHIRPSEAGQMVELELQSEMPADIIASLYELHAGQLVPALPLAKASAAVPDRPQPAADQAVVQVAPSPPVKSISSPPPAPPSSQAKEKKSSGGHAAASEGSSMRVSTRLLDELLEATGNMVMARNQMLSRYNFQEDISFAVLSRCITEMHKSVVQQRMQHIGSLFERFRRPVRDLANKLGKEVEFQAIGADIELDRTIIEAFADPLNHMVRNAVDHAIEDPAVRQERGKSRVGRIMLRAYHQSGEVIVEIEDDGGGIDHERVRSKAIDKGLISAEKARAMSPREILHLIFSPGFSTKDQSTDVSGRGVGMDVVKTNVERIGGAVEVHTNLGAGTIFAFRLPLTQTVVSSSLISAIVVEVAGQRFVLPQTAVNEIIQIDPQDQRDYIKQLDGEDVYQLRDKVLAIVHLEDCLSLERTFLHPLTGEVKLDRRSRIADRRQTESHENAQRFAHQRTGGDRRRNRQTLIVLDFRRALFGILVDAVVGVEEVVVRSTPKLLQSVPGFCGHTVLGDGSVVMMLDVAGIVEKRGLRLHDLPEHRFQAKSALKTAQQMITFENAPGEFFAIPLMMITLIEQIAAKDIHRIGKREYYQLKDATIPLLRLEEHLEVTPHREVEAYHLILPARVPKPLGILVGSNLRIADFSESFDAHNDSKNGVVGTAYYEGHVVTLVDLYALAERAMPEAFAAQQKLSGVTRVLLAEDNKFFAKLVSSYLQIPGIELEVVEDGQQAWDLLQRQREYFDFIISDIEMPRMNGFE
ncbi:MAG: response regulator [Planctomycetota bacterium]|nr:MAG: response regulator [Planctomycetota bacterium]